MIEEQKGDILAQPRGLIVHGCNCQGVMGSGIALQVKEQFPKAFKAYEEWHRIGNLKLGLVQTVWVNPQKAIINAMTQDGYGGSQRRVNYEAVATCFEQIESLARIFNLPVLFPSIGAGLGGGNWEIIKTIIDQSVADNIRKIHFTL